MTPRTAHRPPASRPPTTGPATPQHHTESPETNFRGFCDALRRCRPPPRPSVALQPSGRSTDQRLRLKTAVRSDEKLTVAEVCAELKISRSTFYDWRQKGRAPKCLTLPNGALRVRRSELDRWLDSREDAA